MTDGHSRRYHASEGTGAPAASGSGDVPEPIDHDAEQEILGSLLAQPRALVLVASDLHLGGGRDAETGMFVPSENFFADDSFRRWLESQYGEATEPILLVINGDAFDFTRITARPETDADFALWHRRLARLGRAMTVDELRGSLTRSESWFGLRTDDFKSVWKLHFMLDGHRTFLETLADWLRAGNLLIVTKGNHDLELYWPLVRQALRSELVGAGAPPESVREHLAFVDGGFTLANLWVEHGHVHERMTAVEGSPVLDGRPTELKYPLGSFLNRYLVNAVERLNPFIDNIKPIEEAFLAVLRAHPLRVVRHYFRAWRFVWRSVQMSKGPWRTTVTITLGLVLPPLTIIAIGVFLSWPESWQWVVARIPFLGRPGVGMGTGILGLVFPILLPYLIGAVRELLRALNLSRPVDHVEEGTRVRLREVFPADAVWGRVYAVVGHTHRQGVTASHEGGREHYYVNTGTWIPLWSANRQDLLGRVRYSFTRFDLVDGEYRHQSLEWDDQAGEPRVPRLIEGIDG